MKCYICKKTNIHCKVKNVPICKECAEEIISKEVHKLLTTPLDKLHIPFINCGN